MTPSTNTHIPSTAGETTADKYTVGTRKMPHSLQLHVPFTHKTDPTTPHVPLFMGLGTHVLNTWISQSQVSLELTAGTNEKCSSTGFLNPQFGGHWRSLAAA